MRRRDCREEEMLAAQRQDRLDEEQDLHLQGCASCRDALAVDQLLRRDAEQLREVTTLSSPRLIWEMARRRARVERVRKATWTITLTQWVTAACAAATTAWAIFRGWPSIREWLVAGSEVLNPTSFSALMAGGSLMFTALGVGLLLMLDGLYTSWSRSGI